MAGKKPMKVQVVEVVKIGKQFNIPEGMTFDDAILALQRKKEHDEKVVDIIEEVDAFVWDGALALQKAIVKQFGWADPQATPGFFGSTPPKMIQVETGVNESTLVAWGRFTLPGIEGYLNTGYTKKNNRFIFQFTASVKRKYEDTIRALAEEARNIVKTDSIYKGKAIRIKFSGEDEMPRPIFIDASKVDENDIVFSEIVETSIRANITTPIINAAACRKFKIPLKRGILLSGKYGTGKTLVANKTAKDCVNNGWTFLMCDSAEEIRDMVEFAHHYQPAVIFCEDIDRVLEGDRTIEMDEILNIIDGIESKNTELMVVLTTNNVEKIHPAMLRPGRLDAVINVLPPDAKAVERLIHIYGRGLVNPKEDLHSAGILLNGKIPAIIRECVERAKLFAIDTSKGESFTISCDNLCKSAMSMEHQLELLEGGVKKLTPLEEYGAAARVLFGTQNASDATADEVVARFRKHLKSCALR